MASFRSVSIDLGSVDTWDQFHDVFAKAMGFPDFYGRNMDAWIDCMTSLDAPEDGMTEVHAPPGGVFVLELENMADLKQRCPETRPCETTSGCSTRYSGLKMGNKNRKATPDEMAHLRSVVEAAYPGMSCVVGGHGDYGGHRAPRDHTISFRLKNASGKTCSNVVWLMPDEINSLTERGVIRRVDRANGRRR